jgi:DNA modification methylase
VVELCILAGCPESGIVLDPFIGSGTTAVVAQRLGRKFVGIESNADYCEMARGRVRQQTLF